MDVHGSSVLDWSLPLLLQCIGTNLDQDPSANVVLGRLFSSSCQQCKIKLSVRCLEMSCTIVVLLFYRFQSHTCKFVHWFWLSFFFFFYSFVVKAAPRLFDIFSSKNTAAFTPANTVNIVTCLCWRELSLSPKLTGASLLYSDLAFTVLDYESQQWLIEGLPCYPTVSTNTSK